MKGEPAVGHWLAFLKKNAKLYDLLTSGKQKNVVLVEDP